MVDMMKAELEICGQHPRIKKFDFSGRIASLETTEKSLKTFQESAESWIPVLDLEQEIAKLEILICKFRRALATATRWRKSFDDVSAEGKAEDNKAKRSYRNKRDGLSRKLHESSLPKGPSKHAAELIQCLAGVGEPAVIDPPPQFVQNELQVGNETVELFNEPSIISTLELVQEGLEHTQWHHECARFVLANSDIVMAKSAEVEKLLVKGKMVAMSTCKDASVLKWSEEGKIMWFTQVAESRVIVMVQLVFGLDSRIEAFPWGGRRNIITMFKGSAIVFVVTPEQARSADIHQWLQKASPAALDKNRAYILDEGCSLYTPFGCTPVVIGIPEDRSVLQPREPGRRPCKGITITKTETVTYTISLCHDVALDQSAPADTKSYVSSNAVRATNWLPAFFCTEQFTKWREALVASAAPAPAIECCDP